MKTPQLVWGAAALLFGCAPLLAQVGFDFSNSKWGAGNANSFYDASGTAPGLVTTTNGNTGTTAYGQVRSVADGYVFGFANSPPGIPAAPYNLSTTGLTAGTALHLVFTGFSAAPKYVSYTGGALTGYSYNGGTGTLSLDVSTIDPVASGSDPLGTTLNSVFGVKFTTTGSFNYTGTVFRADMWWGDINPMNLSYAGISPSAGVNASGVDGVTATFHAYFPATFLSSIGINQPADATALLRQFDGNGINLPLARDFFSAGGLDPGFSNGNYTYGGASVYDFNGGGNDDYALFTYANSNWSTAGNIGIAAVPEPGTYAMVAGAAALLFGAVRRRARTG